MITEDQLSLITAAVDGELSPAETLLFRRLLDSSPETRIVYALLKDDSTRLRNLPTAAPPAQLRQRVMTRIAALTPPPIARPDSTPTSPTRHYGTQTQPAGSATLPFVRGDEKTRRWVPVAIAASLLFAITGSSFWFFSRPGGKATNLAHNANRPLPATRSSAGDPDANWLPSESGPRLIAPTPNIAPLPDSQIVRNDFSTSATRPSESMLTAIAPEPRVRHNPDIMGAEIRPSTPPLDLIRVRVPFLKSLSEFDLEDTRKQFAEELVRDPAFRIDVFARNLPRGVEWLRATAKTTGVMLFVDPTTLERVNKGQVNSVVVYTESLTAAELADLFAKLCVEDAKISPRVFDVIHATPVMQADQEALRAILGIDPGLYKRPTQEKGSDSAKPISAGTADQIVKTLTAGQGKGSEKSAMLLTWLPTAARTAPGASVELKQFLLKRGERKANAVPVVIVIRHGNG
jgi:hypothetical protein